MNPSATTPASAVTPTSTNTQLAFPHRPGFLWGTATAAHQVEGNNYASDWWQLEHSGSTVVAEPSGDAADHFHRWPEDLDLLAGLGLNAYRFSVEWARIEPERGYISRAMIDHYRRMVAGCLERGITPIVTLQHVTMPAWFRRAGGWAADSATELFAVYAETVLPVIREGVQWVCTINEPNLQPLMTKLHANDPEALAAWNGGPMPVPSEQEVADLIAAHRSATEVVHSVPGVKAGWTVSIADLQFDADGESAAREWFERYEGRFLRAARGDDFVGVQNYFRTTFDRNGLVPVGPDARMTDLWEFYPQALGHAVKSAWEETEGTPILVTENGIPTGDDELRIEFLDTALASLGEVMRDGVEVLGYLHWSALDNFEWAMGYEPRFGLIEFDPVTFERRVKPSARHYSDLVRSRLRTN
ncbi:putative beta-galactosidase [Microlunatus phosphovorus NM-1]|uniref:Putative beta-galactosidase n=1 Tax=Microlunatus phosphovorus (strain ATCC 700054 / DSM 10555 / JCM 9379 / NBRC 101784 / NCIMB 13414 / VKM Ac-1990 / NM-1) TaxID=1032480 RepID=F5XLS1_MICPN|nr:family 1 glycosylhydrolase [Microlunatus phosphovorus]BAK33800.1 putative beta-galactosidase [Microlunatus phosphovorus NM-1]